MDFRKIEYFIEVADCRSFRKAAERIHISHQGLSKQIRLLEEELGAALLERDTANVSLTDVGRKFYDSFQPLVKEANASYSEMKEYIALRKSMLNVGYFNVISFYRVVNPVLDSLKAQKPELNIDIFAADIGEVRSRLLEDKCDLIITVMIDPEDWKTVSRRILLTFPLKLIVSRRHPWYERDQVTEQDLAGASLLYYGTGSAVFMKKMKVQNRISMYNYDTYMGRLSEGNEFGVVGDIYSSREGEFRLLDLPEKYRADAWIIAAYKKEHPLNRLLEKLQPLSTL